MNTGRRSLLKGAVVLAGSGAAGWLSSLALPASALAQQTPAGGGSASAATGSQLILLGTQGGPIINLQRGEASSAIVSGGVPYLIDCGYGTLRALAQAGLPLNDVVTVFLTHLHDDHTSDVAAFLSHKWTAGDPKPTRIYGPRGTVALVAGAMAFSKANTEIRTVDEGRSVKPEAVFSGRDLSAPKITEVFRDERVTVRAVENTHFPERAKAKMTHRSLAYRFNLRDRSIVFSGDTAYSSALVELAKDADVLVCEAIDVALYAQLVKTAQAAPGGLSGESVARHIIETHVTTEEAGRMAQESRVKTLVLNHLVPGANPARGGNIPDAQYIDAVRKHFDGNVIVGADQMKL